jgi:hypothetical protein
MTGTVLENRPFTNADCRVALLITTPFAKPRTTKTPQAMLAGFSISETGKS